MSRYTPQSLAKAVEPALKAAQLTALLPVVADENGITFGGADGELGITVTSDSLVPWYVAHYPGSRDYPPDADVIDIPTVGKLLRADEAVQVALDWWLSHTVLSDINMNEYAEEERPVWKEVKA